MDLFYLSLIKRIQWMCLNMAICSLFCPYEFQGNLVTSSHVSHTSVSPTAFLSGQNSFYPPVSCSTFSNRVSTDVWRVKVVTSPHDYRAKQSLPQPPSLLCILSFPPTGFHTQCWTFPHGTLLTCSAMTLVGGLELRKVRDQLDIGSERSQ